MKARATLHGVVHTVPGDIDALLVGPAGQRSILMSDVCTGGALSGLGETFTFDDAAAGALPASASCAGLSGTFKPSDFDAGDGNDALFGPLVPPGPHPVTLSVFNGVPPNGSWQLFVADDVEGQNGSIAGGWSLELLPSTTCGGQSATAAAQVGTAGNDQFQGTAGDDIFIGLGGDDTATGLAGNDLFCGNEGNDTLRGGANKDKLIGGANKDKLVGGPAKDKLIGQGGKDKLKGGGGNDTCKGGKGGDTLRSC